MTTLVQQLDAVKSGATLAREAGTLYTSIQKFIEGSDNIALYLDSFEVTVRANGWPLASWSLQFIGTIGTLSGDRLLAISILNIVQQGDFMIV